MELTMCNRFHVKVMKHLSNINTTSAFVSVFSLMLDQ